MNETSLQSLNLEEFLKDATAIQVYGSGKNREVINNVKRVIINKKYIDETVEPEALIVCDKYVFRLIPSEKLGFDVKYSNIGETFDEFGKCLIDRDRLKDYEKDM